MSEGAAPEANDALRAQRLLRLIQLWAWLEPYASNTRIFPTPVLPPRTVDGLDESVEQVVKRWRDLFANELETVQLARNAVAHATPIAIANVDNASALAERLLTLLEARIGTIRDPDRLDYAVAAYRNDVDRYHRAGDRHNEARALHHLGRTYADLGLLSEAAEILGQALDRHRDAGEQEEADRLQAELADVQVRQEASPT